jgi:hypothetical protein
LVTAQCFHTNAQVATTIPAPAEITEPHNSQRHRGKTASAPSAMAISMMVNANANLKGLATY